jgi:hypothetical protein
MDRPRSASTRWRSSSKSARLPKERSAVSSSSTARAPPASPLPQSVHWAGTSERLPSGRLTSRKSTPHGKTPHLPSAHTCAREGASRVKLAIGKIIGGDPASSRSSPGEGTIAACPLLGRDTLPVRQRVYARSRKGASRTDDATGKIIGGDAVFRGSREWGTAIYGGSPSKRATKFWALLCYAQQVCDTRAAGRQDHKSRDQGRVGDPAAIRAAIAQP